MIPAYRNEPPTDFSVSEHRVAMQRALRDVSNMLGATYPVVIGGEHIVTDDTIASLNPTSPKQVVGYACQANADLVQRAIAMANDAFQSWKRVPVEARARMVLRTAAIMRRRKPELSAWMVYEASKSWPEADGDVAEAIDFCEFYARRALQLQGEPQPLTPYPGEDNEVRYIPLGAGVTIPPWNFPLAILTGTTIAPVVTGNTVVLKPSPYTPVIAAKFMEILREAGMPPGVVNLTPGGAEVGEALVDHPRTRFIVFTGSKNVGVRISQRAAVRQPGQIWLKRAILEMGGKDAIVVDETADLEAAADGIVTSAFGFQGQKCSACSRAIVVESVYDQLLKMVVERARQIKMGNPVEPETFMGAVIDKAAFDKICNYIAIGREEGRLVLGGEVIDHGRLADTGYFITPTIFADVAPDARIAQEEIFGPVLAFIKARDFDHALEIANGTEYALTGALYSRSMERLERAREEFHVGNLYFNRKCTGSLVGVQPFGGFNMSGTDSKAGGYDYLIHFTQPKTITERL